LGAAAGCLYTEHLGERERTLQYYSHFRKHGEKFPKMVNMTKSTLKSPKIYRKITPKLKK
jgi:hypothetical protein